MPENNDNQQQGLQFEISQEVAQGDYSNMVLISHSSSDFVLDFARMLPGMPKATVRNRIVMTPEHAKRLLIALQENVANFEHQFGKIQIPNMPPRTATPFNIKKGEA